MDVLTDVLTAIQIKGALYFDVNASHNWIAETPSMELIGASMLPEAEYVIPFHIMLDGNAWARPKSNSLEALKIESGDVVMFPLGTSHILTSDSSNWDGIAADADFYKEAAARDHPFTFVAIGEGVVHSNFICGYIGFNVRPFNPLLNTLPEMLVVKEHFKKGSLMNTLLVSTISEMKKYSAGAHNIVTKLSEVIFTEALRQHMDSLTDSSSKNWLSAQKDLYIGKALELIHQDPVKKWTLEILAKECGLSRSSLAERFNQCVGQPPMQYANRWKMQIASKYLSDGASIVSVAEKVGYSSEAAFQKAFKKQVGMAPGEWRKKHRDTTQKEVS